MKKSLLSFSVAVFVLLAAGGLSCNAAPRLVYNGDTLEWNTDFVKTKSGTLIAKENVKEVSGIACSRVTPGYIWMQSDDYESFIIATDEVGAKRRMTVRFNQTIRWDWEDMSGGVYNDTNYLFIGAFGDNDEDDGNYSIVYFKEPAIDTVNSSITITPNKINFVYPDGRFHNCEALMYDNVEQMIYIITKVYYNVCQVFSLPFRLDYGTETQTLTYICDLGVRSDLGEHSQNKPYKGFHLVTAADISPSGKYILIKNHNNIVATYSWILYWERQEGESVADAVKRQPQPLKCYQWEEQGEAICWLDEDVFYTVSDSNGDTPIFKYTRKQQDIETVQPDTNAKAHLTLINNVMYVSCHDGLYTLDGRKVERAE